MPSPESAQESYQFIQRLQALLVASSRRAWSRMTPDFDASWQAVGPQLTAVVSAGQLAAAQRATTYVPAVLTETGQPDSPEARVRPQAFSGVAADGRSLQGLLTSSVVHAKTGSAAGLSSQMALGVGERWLDGLVQTAVTDAFRLATEAETAVRPNLGFVRQVNPPCCGRCAVLAGRWYPYDAGFARHPRCFPAGVVVSGPGNNAASRRQYDGELVILSTASGQNLPLTGNHPVLTSRGWVPANLIQESDHVVRSTLPNGAVGLVIPDHHEVPSRIEDVWDALSMSVFARMPTSPEDFHGDGQHGYVDVVRADSTLRDGWVRQPLGEQVVESELASRVGVAQRFNVKGTPALVDLRNSTLPSGPMGFGRLSQTLLRGHPASSHQARLASAATLHPRSYQPLGDCSSTDSVFAREGQFAGPGLVGADDIGHRQFDTPRWDAPGDSFSMETSEGYASRGLDLLDRLASQVELDRVVEIRRVQWSGHVYSLTSSEGWHSANSLIVSNCDCIGIPSSENVAGSLVTDPAQLFDSGQVRGLTKRERERLAEGIDPAKVINESRDMWRARIREQRSGVDRSVSVADRDAANRNSLEAIFASVSGRQNAVQQMRTAGFVD